MIFRKHRWHQAHKNSSLQSFRRVLRQSLKWAILVTFLFILFFYMVSQRDLSIPTAASTLKVAISIDPTHIDPSKASDGLSGLVLRMISEGLTRLGSKSEPLPALAYHWAVSDDGKEYTFLLRPAYWSDGNIVTAHDFVRGWQKMLRRETAAPNAYFLFPIERAKLIYSGEAEMSSLGVKALDDHTLVVTLEEPLPYFLQTLAFDAFFPLHPSLESKPGEEPQEPINNYSCGPFILSSWKPRNELILVANPRYWDRAHVYMSKIELIVVSQPQTALHLFEKGEVDWMGSLLSFLPQEELEKMQKMGKLETSTASSSYWVQCQLKHPLLQNQKARVALSLAIDRNALAQALGASFKPATHLVPPHLSKVKEIGLYRDQTEHPNLKFDPERAKELWKEACSSLEQAPQLEYIFNSTGPGDFQSVLAQLLQAQWRQNLQTDVKLQATEWALHIDRVKRANFDLARFGWSAQYSDPCSFLNIFETSEGAYNFSHFNDTRFRHFMQLARQTSSLERYFALQAAENILLEEMPVIPLLFSSHLFLKNPSLKGVVIGSLGRVDFKSAYWQLANHEMPRSQ